MVTSEKNALKTNRKSQLMITLAAMLLLATATVSLTSCHNQPKQENTEQDSAITNEQKLAKLEADLEIAQKEYYDALKLADDAQAEADHKAKIAKKKGTKEAKAEAKEAQKKADELKADADAKGEKVKELESEISQLKIEMEDEVEETKTPTTATPKTEKKAVADNEKKTTDNTETPKLSKERLQKDFETISTKWKNGKNSKQKANQFCTGTLGLKLRNNDPYTMMEQHFKSLDNEKKNEMIEQMRNFKFSSDDD